MVGSSGRSRGRWRARLLLLALVLPLAGCGSPQNTLAPESSAERAISHLFWVVMTGAWIGLGVIGFLLFLGWWRRKQGSLPFGIGDWGATALIVGLGVGVPIVVLSLLFVWSDVIVIRKTDAPRVSSTQMTIDVVGHQWFWEVRYPGTNAVTANEIHIPTGTRVNVVVTTADVIHSFWVPQLNRKIDTIPGRRNRVLLVADKPGRYRGQCTEYCGLQHAHMGLAVIAQRPAEFRAWLANMARPAPAPTTAEARRGRAVFLENACAGCHQIRGTDAHGRIGPDLTHLQSRQTLAALTIPNRKGYLAGWVLDPQHVKPGNKMPGLNLKGPDFQALLDYLESLK